MTKTALLVMDVQRGIVARFDSDPEYLPRLARAIETARAAGIPVIYVVLGFRPGHPEVSGNNAIFGRVASSGDGFTAQDPNAEVHPDVAPRPGDIVVTKKRVSGFAGSDLEMVLRSSAVDTIALTGIATSGVVLSTLRQAADLDFRVVVLADGCLDADEEVHRVLTTKVFPRQAEVTTIADWTATIKN
ncbi:MAG TPA: isochorismatase family cysteine hydrolase [Pseudonocardiaceae bacterium]|jgi:nicotinamidase-related amidase|nr:isochorismatase family cysteine hydrolase [Pseudonocardiaceae bacterium]